MRTVVAVVLGLLRASSHCAPLSPWHLGQSFYLENRGSSLSVADDDGRRVLLEHTDWLHLREEEEEVLADAWVLKPVKDGGRVNICSRNDAKMCLATKRGRVGRVELRRATTSNKRDKVIEFEVEEEAESQVRLRADLAGGDSSSSSSFYLCSRVALDEDKRTAELAAFVEEGFEEKRCSFKLLPFA